MGKKPGLAYFHADLESEFANAAVEELSFVYQPLDLSSGVAADASLNLLVSVIYQESKPVKDLTALSDQN